MTFLKIIFLQLLIKKCLKINVACRKISIFSFSKIKRLSNFTKALNSNAIM